MQIHVSHAIAREIKTWCLKLASQLDCEDCHNCLHKQLCLFIICNNSSFLSIICTKCAVEIHVASNVWKCNKNIRFDLKALTKLQVQARFELATFCVWGRRDSHYTIEPTDSAWRPLRFYTTGLKVEIYTAVQSYKALSARFTSKQILPFGFAVQYRPGMTLWRFKILCSQCIMWLSFQTVIINMFVLHIHVVDTEISETEMRVIA